MKIRLIHLIIRFLETLEENMDKGGRCYPHSSFNGEKTTYLGFLWSRTLKQKKTFIKMERIQNRAFYANSPAPPPKKKLSFKKENNDATAFYWKRNWWLYHKFLFMPVKNNIWVHKIPIRSTCGLSALDRLIKSFAWLN